MLGPFPGWLCPSLVSVSRRMPVCSCPIVTVVLLSLLSSFIMLNLSSLNLCLVSVSSGFLMLLFFKSLLRTDCAYTSQSWHPASSLLITTSACNVSHSVFPPLWLQSVEGGYWCVCGSSPVFPERTLLLWPLGHEGGCITCWWEQVDFAVKSLGLNPGCSSS